MKAKVKSGCHGSYVQLNVLNESKSEIGVPYGSYVQLNVLNERKMKLGWWIL
jgi:hypothetical protein